MPPRALAAWLGILALGLNALVPIRFAIGLTASFLAARQCGSVSILGSPPDPAWRLLAVLTGQDSGAGPAHSHQGLHPRGGALCGFVANPPGAAGPCGAALPPPPCRAAAAAIALETGTAAQASPNAYHPRAPPNRTALILT